MLIDVVSIHKQYSACARLPISTVRMRRRKRDEPWTCTYYCRGHTPHCKQLLWLQLSVQWQHSRSVRTSLPDYCRYDKEQISPLALLEAQCLAPAPAQQASWNTWRFHINCSTMHTASLAVAVATLLCAHGPTVLTDSEPCSAGILHQRHTFIATRRIQDAYPCPSCNDTEYRGI